MREITPYVNFDGNCREAMSFYKECLGGELYLMTFGESGHAPSPEVAGRLIHARLNHGATVLMASDTMPGMGMNDFHRGNDVWLSVACETDQEVDEAFAKLSAGGTTMMAPHDAFWNSRFAMFTDRYGVHWMLNHERAPVGAS